MAKNINDIIIKKLEIIESELKEVRQTDIPKLKIDMAVVKTESNNTAKIISGVIGLVTFIVTSAIAWLR